MRPNVSFTQLLTQETGSGGLDFGNNHFNEEEFGQGTNVNENDILTIVTPTDGLTTNISTCIIEEIVASEGLKYVVNGTEINNNLLGDGLDDAQEGMNDEDTSIAYQDAPSSEFTRIDGISNADIDILRPDQDSLRPNDSTELYVGQRFNSKDELQSTVKLYSLKVHQQYHVVHSNRNLWELKCKLATTCSWKLRASVPRGASFFEIKTYNGPHTCLNPIINRDHVQLDSEFVACQIKPLVKAQLSITLTTIQALISDKFGYDISKKKAWKAKQKAIISLFGDWIESYKLLPRYLDVLVQENLASIEGFKHCRPVISVDGTHLYGKYKGR